MESSSELHLARRRCLRHTGARIALLLSVCGWIAVTTAADTTPGVTAADAWIRWLPANLPAGGYLTLHNAGDQPQLLTAVSSSDYRDVTLHRTSVHDGISSMEPAPQIPIPPHRSVRFAPGGYHIMLEHATRSVQPGDRVSMRLSFADGSTLTVPFEVRRPDAGDRP